MSRMMFIFRGDEGRGDEEMEQIISAIVFERRERESISLNVRGWLRCKESEYGWRVYSSISLEESDETTSAEKRHMEVIIDRDS